MTKQEWIEAVVSKFHDEYQREAIRRQLTEKLDKLVEQNGESWTIRELGDPAEYFEKYYGQKSSSKFNRIAGIILIALGTLLIVAVTMFPDNTLFDQSSWMSGNFYYASGVILALGIISLVHGLRKK